MLYPHLKEKNIIIMPFHIKSVLLYHSLIDNGINVIGFWDNSTALQGMTYDDLEITQPLSACSLTCEATIVVYYKRYENEITKQLNDMGLFDLVYDRELDLTDTFNYYNSINDVDLCCINPRYERRLYINSKIFDLSNESELLNIITAQTGQYGKKKNARIILLISHDLGINGAPIALQNAASVIASNGDIPIISNKTTGNLLPSLLNDNIPVLIDYKLTESDYFLSLASFCDTVIVNTVTEPSLIAIEKLSGLPIPVLWWTHEGLTWLSGMSEDFIQKKLGKNINVFCVGELARQHLLHVKPEISVRILLYGIKDHFRDSDLSTNNHIKVMTVGLFDTRKGQDIFCAAIRKLDDALRQKCEFIFVGKAVDSEPVYLDVLKLKNEFPNNVILTGEVDRDCFWKVLSECDCMVCSSREDPMPIFITEAMMFHKICICSENTGFANLIEDGENGFLYPNNSADELCEKLEYYIRNYDNFADMKQRSRLIYEKNFTFTTFNKNLIGILDEIEN